MRNAYEVIESYFDDVSRKFGMILRYADEDTASYYFNQLGQDREQCRLVCYGGFYNAIFVPYKFD